MSKHRKYTKEVLEAVVKDAYSISDVLRMLNIQVAGGNHRTIQKYLKIYEIDTSHFTGSLWAKGKRKETNASLMTSAIKKAWPDELVFCENSRYIKSVRSRYLKLGIEYKCVICGIQEWMNNPISLHLDHINGINNDNRLSNLRLLCPNCHQQTSTWGNNSGHKRM
jgi:hypothetical protein